MSQQSCFRNGFSGSCVTFDSSAHRSGGNCAVRPRSRIVSSMETYSEDLSLGFDKLNQLSFACVEERDAAAVERDRGQRLAHDLCAVRHERPHARFQVGDAITDVIQTAAM